MEYWSTSPLYPMHLRVPGLNVLNTFTQLSPISSAFVPGTAVYAFLLFFLQKLGYSLIT